MAARERSLDLTVDRCWSGRLLSVSERSEVSVVQTGELLTVGIDAPFSGDPAPPPPARPLEGLWEFEVVELFVATTATPHRYLELELCPHGHSLALLFDAPRERSGTVVEVSSFEAKIRSERWTGHASIIVPSSLLDLEGPTVRANAFRLSGSPRRNELAFPLPGSQPDFHQPEHFPELSWTHER